MIKIFISVILSLFLIPNLYAAQSTILESDGYACMGEDKSMKDTERAAIADAKDKASKNASTYIKGETKLKDAQLANDIIAAYNSATVVVDKEIEKGWYTDPSLGKCYKIKIRANVIPDEKAMKKTSQETIDDPSAPLNVQIWTDKKEYKTGEQIKIEVDPPYGDESVIVYAGTSPLGDINLKAEGGIFRIVTKPKDIGSKTRGVVLKEKGTGKDIKNHAEFSETGTDLKTKK